jgi:transposase
MDGKDSMINEYLGGSTVIDIAKKYGVTREAVYQRLRKIPGWGAVKEKSRVSKKRARMEQYEGLRDEIYEMAEKGIYRVEIMKKFNISAKVLKDLFKGSKYDLAPTARMPVHNEIRREYGKGVSKKALMAKYELSYPHICRIIKKYNIK